MSKLKIGAVLFALPTLVIMFAVLRQGWIVKILAKRSPEVLYTLVLKVGPGEFDTIGIHRVVRERWPYCPIKSSREIMMLHGDNSDFSPSFLVME
jgi:hypothetical protein